MADKQYLLTYIKAGTTNFDWFDTEEEMRDFYRENEDIKVLDSVRVWNVQEIDLDK
ncbi:hypothetical protein [Bacillus haynesii]|uniref:hypothetical protein n=1 Tax=Bacillus haynesii TaxID=1925021 RepID=UPI0035DCAD52